MNRREALAALMALPATTRITRAEVKTSDIIVIESPTSISRDVIHRIETRLKGVWPDNRIIVLTEGLSLKVVDGAKV